MKRVTPDDYYNDGLFEMARYGKVISMINKLTKDQHNDYLDAIIDKYDEAVNEIDKIIQDIRTLVLVTEPSNLLNFIYSMNMMCSFNKESEIDFSEELNAQLRSLEYIQSVLVSLPNKQSPNAKDLIKDDAHLAKILSLTTDLYIKISRFYLLWAAKAKREQRLTDDELTYSMISQSMSLVRGNQYQCFKLETLHELIAPHADEILELYNISIDELMNGLKAMEYNLSSGRLDSAKELAKIIDSSQGKPDSITDLDRKTAIEVFDKTVGINLHNVKKHTGWPDSLIEDLTLDISSDKTFFNHDSFKGWPLWELPIIRKPFIKLYGKSYCFDYNTLFDNFYRSLQNAVFSHGDKYKEMWKNAQTDASEESVGKIFKKLLPNCVVYRTNYYPIDGGSAENDVIVTYKDVLFIIEVKAGAFTYTPAFFDLEAHKKSLKDLIQKAGKQCIRTKNYILSCIEAKFSSDAALKNYKFSICRDKYSQIYMLNITVDAINEIASAIEKIELAKIQEDIISLSIEDMWVYYDYFDNPAQFIHFMKQRFASTRSDEVYTWDELDHLGLYINHNMYALYAEEIGQGSTVNFSGYREELDRYYAHKQRGIPTEKPKQDIPEYINQIINICTENENIDCPLRFTNYLLDLSSDGRLLLSNWIDKLIARDKETGRANPAICFGDICYCLLVTIPSVNSITFDIRDYIEANLLKSNQDNCYLIKLEMDEYNHIINVFAQQFEKDAIEPERVENLKEFINQMEINRITANINKNHGVKIGRNDPCPCGSGKKFKKCCEKRWLEK